MTFLEFTAAENDNDRRLDRIIRKCINAQNLSGIYSAIRKGFIKVNGKKKPPETHIFSGDKITIARFLVSQEDATAAASTVISDDNGKPVNNETHSNYSFPYSIVFQNENILVLNKPSGVPVHGKENSLEKEVRHLFDMTAKDTSLAFVPGPVHRLDKYTSGLIAFSWSIKGAHWFLDALSHNKIHKSYLGIASGILKEEIRWEDFIFDGKKNAKNTIKKRHEQFHTVFASQKKENDFSKRALTTATPLAYGEYKTNPVTVIQYKIETGRTHQIRAQSALHHLPLIGDTAYGAKKIPSAEFFLHAQKLEAPKENAIALPAVLQAELTNEFKQFLKECRIQFQ
ncbi:MAG: RluA family pseudouridine synthase [Treponemataceae bacterium]|nr:RluA family pseudouridine synthase [Treponemataceae bacterium]